MKLLYVEIARAIWLFDTRLVNPKGLDLKPFFEILKERFGFSVMPAHPRDFKDNALVFDAGSFTNLAGQSIAVTLKTYVDGIIAETASNTNDTIEFFDQLTTAISDSGYEIPKEDLGELGFVSQMRVQFDAPLISINPKLERANRFIESHMNSLDGEQRRFEMTGIEFFSEDISKPKAPIAFKLERKYGAPFAANEYFTRAPLQTDYHIKLLEDLESIILQP